MVDWKVENCWVVVRNLVVVEEEGRNEEEEERGTLLLIWEEEKEERSVEGMDVENVEEKGMVMARKEEIVRRVLRERVLGLHSFRMRGNERRG